MQRLLTPTTEPKFWLPDHGELPDFWQGSYILVDKPYGFTSFKVVHQIRKAITRHQSRKLKIGHAGTLDPLASGLLILATGKFTSFLDHFQGLEKEYTGRFRLGHTRATYDMESGIEQSYPLPSCPDLDLIERVRLSLTGELMISPPAHSAIQKDGKRAYQSARSGKTIVLDPRPMTVTQFMLDAGYFPELRFTILCSKGTYIRSLAHEFGTRSGLGAYLSALQRTAIGTYRLEQAWPLSQLLDRLNTIHQRSMQ